MNSGMGFSKAEHIRVDFQGVNDTQNNTVPPISHEAKALCSQFKATTCTMEIMCKPSDQILKFVREQMGLPMDDEAMDVL